MRAMARCERVRKGVWVIGGTIAGKEKEERSLARGVRPSERIISNKKAPVKGLAEHSVTKPITAYAIRGSH